MPYHVGPSGRERPAYPEYEERFGEDPARYLWTRDPEGIEPHQPGDLPELADAICRIRGITDEALLDAWLDVETDLAFGPRKPVVRATNRKRAELTGEVEEADLRLESIFDREDLLACRDSKPAADGGRTSLAPEDRHACDDCGEELEYLGVSRDARDNIISEFVCRTPRCEVDEVIRR